MPNIGVAVAVIRDDKVLLTQREDFEVWCLPGGGVDANETVEQAGIREVREETGLAVQIVGLVGLCSRPFWTVSGAHMCILAATPLSGDLVPEPTEVAAVAYFDAARLPDPRLLHHLAYIEAALTGVRGRLWSTNARTPPVFHDRAALYRWRDALGVSRQEAYRILLDQIVDPKLHVLGATNGERGVQITNS